MLDLIPQPRKSYFLCDTTICFNVLNNENFEIEISIYRLNQYSNLRESDLHIPSNNKPFTKNYEYIITIKSHIEENVVKILTILLTIY